MQTPQSGTVRTATGRLIDPFAPAPADIEILDIAHALAHQCRFAGHVSRFFSVAQHCVHVSELASQASPGTGMWGLLHDASEAYLVDVPRPLKQRHAMRGYRDAEVILQSAIYAHFGCRGPVPDAVHWADDLQLAIEFRDLMPARPGDRWLDLAGSAPRLRPMLPIEAKDAFITRFLTLQRGTRS